MHRLRLAPLLLLPLLACAGPDAKEDESLLTEAERAELREIVERRMAEVSSNVSLSETQRETIRPIVQKAKNEFILASRKYRADPTPRNRERFEAKMRDLGQRLRRDLQPHMTNAQLNQFLVVVDQVILDVRAARE